MSQQSVAQTGNHLLNLAISNVTHDSSGDYAYLVIKSDNSITSALSVDYDTSQSFTSPNLRTVSSTGQTGDDGYQRHEVLLHHLAASSVIYYRVRDSLGNIIAQANFRTAQLEGEPFTFGVVSDLHSGDGISSDVTSIGSPNWAKTLQRMSGENLDLALSCGDALMVRGWWPCCGWGYYETLAQIKQKYNTLFSGSDLRPGGMQQLTDSVPLYTAMGNHEEIEYPVAKTAYEQEFSLPVNNGNEALIYGEEYYSFDRGDTHFVSLSTDIPDPNYPLDSKLVPEGQQGSDCCLISGAQKAWLDADLSNTTKRWKVVFFHRTMYLGLAPESDPNHGKEAIVWGNCVNTFFESDPLDPNSCITKARINRDETHELLNQHGVNLVFQGHAHNYSRHIKDGVSYVITGGGGYKGIGDVWAYPGDVAFNASEHIKVEETAQYLTIKAIETDTGDTLDSFIICSGEVPGLGIASDNIYWASYGNYSARLLSVDYMISNPTGPDAYSVTTAGAVNTNSVTLYRELPAAVDIAKGSSALITLMYNVPSGEGAFRTTIYATAKDACGNSYAYPGPYPGG